MPNNSLGYNPTDQERRGIIIESKRSLTKYKIDTKLQNIKYFMEILNHVSMDDIELNIQYRLNKTIPPNLLFSKPFCTMYVKYNLQQFPKNNITILFGSDDISYVYKEFLLLLNRGIQEDEYNNIVMRLFEEDDILSHIQNNKSIDSILKQSITSCKTPTRLRTLLNDDSLEKYREKILPYCESYTDVADIYNFAKNKIGFLHVDKIIIKNLIPDINQLDNYLKNFL
jgi:hypothetical protein